MPLSQIKGEENTLLMAFFDNIKDKTNHLGDKTNLRIPLLKLVFVVGKNRWKVDEMLNNLLGAESLSLCSLTSRARNITQADRSTPISS